MKANEINHWRDVYSLPLTYDGRGYAWADNHAMALTFTGLSDNDRIKCVNAINENEPFQIRDLFNVGVEFYRGREKIFIVRGWGYLIGIGALNLSPEKAEVLQKQFIRHIFNCLN